MKALKVVLPVALAGLVALWVVSRLSAGREAEAWRIEREALRREAVERAGVARGLAGPAGAEEARAWVRWWVDASSALRQRHPGQGEPERPRGAKESAAEGDFRAYAASRLEALRAGYAPALSAVDQGVRLDVLAIGTGEHPATHERALRLDFALWGAPRRLEREAGGAGDRGAVRVVVPLAFPKLAFRFLDAGGKTYGEMSGAGEPFIALKDPDRFSSELPPGVVLGTWWVEPFPREAARVEISVAAQVQGMTTAALTPTFRWEVPVAEAWQLRPGEAFRAETREVAPEPAGAKK
jgi:hypothetical protein